MTDYDKILKILQDNKGKTDKAVAEEMIKLFINIAGERLKSNEGVKVDLIEHFLTMGYIKPEMYRSVYAILQSSKEKLT